MSLAPRFKDTASQSLGGSGPRGRGGGRLARGRGRAQKVQVDDVEDLDKDEVPSGQPEPTETFRDDAQPQPVDDDERSLAEMALGEKAKGARNPRPQAAAMKRPAAAGMAAGDEAESAAAETEAEAAATEKAEAAAAEAGHVGGGLPAKPTPAESVSGGKDTRRKGAKKKEGTLTNKKDVEQTKEQTKEK